MIRANFDTAAAWVQSRIPADLATQVSKKEIENAFSAMSALIPKAKATFLIPDLFPGVTLEVLYVHNRTEHSTDIKINDTAIRALSLTVSALKAIGMAIEKEMRDSNNEIVHYPLSDESEIVVFLPEVRSVVLQATGTTLLPD